MSNFLSLLFAAMLALLALLALPSCAHARQLETKADIQAEEVKHERNYLKDREKRIDRLIAERVAQIDHELVEYIKNHPIVYEGVEYACGTLVVIEPISLPQFPDLPRVDYMLEFRGESILNEEELFPSRRVALYNIQEMKSYCTKSTVWEGAVEVSFDFKFGDFWNGITEHNQYQPVSLGKDSVSVTFTDTVRGEPVELRVTLVTQQLPQPLNPIE